jgi:hypothetical protein
VEASGGIDRLYAQAVGPAKPSGIKLPRGGSHERMLLHWFGENRDTSLFSS